MTRVAVVGHVEYVDFLWVARYPAAGEIISAQHALTHAAGGGVVAAAVLAELGAAVDFFCALGRDARGRASAAELADRGITVHAAWREAPTRRVVTLLEPDGERTIVTVGDRLQPLGEDELDWPALRRADGVYVTAGNAAAMRRARDARVLVATPRVCEGLGGEGLGGLGGEGPWIDALVFSASDRDESAWARQAGACTRLMVATEGAAGGRWWGESAGRWPAVPPPGPPRDDYGCGDSFAAGFTFGLAQGRSVLDAAAEGATCGARMLTRAGAP